MLHEMSITSRLVNPATGVLHLVLYQMQKKGEHFAALLLLLYSVVMVAVYVLLINRPGCGLYLHDKIVAKQPSICSCGQNLMHVEAGGRCCCGIYRSLTVRLMLHYANDLPQR